MTNKSSGFTLIEVLLVSLLLTFLGFATFQSVRTTVATKEDVEQNTELVQMTRSALAIMERDFREAFYITAEDLGWSPRSKTELNGEQAKPKPLPITSFIGKESQVMFSSRSHQRKSADVPENNEHVVNYELQNAVLVRSESAHLINEEEKEPRGDKLHAFNLLPNVRTFRLTYYDSQKEDWVRSWDSSKDEQKDRLPKAVRVELDYKPDVDSTSRKEVKDTQIFTAFAVAESAFKTSADKKQSAVVDPNNPTATPNPEEPPL